MISVLEEGLVPALLRPLDSSSVESEAGAADLEAVEIPEAFLVAVGRVVVVVVVETYNHDPQIHTPKEV